MKCIKFYTLFLFIIINIIKIKSKIINTKLLETISIINKPKIIHEKRNVNGSNSCRPLISTVNKKKFLNLYYHPISLIMSEARIPFKNCYYEFQSSIIICNEITARYVYIFYLPTISYTEELYGYNNNNSTVKCSLDNSKIKDWSFWLYDNGRFTETYDFNYREPITKSKINYFKLIFENDCVYSLPVLKKDYVKVSMPSECQSIYGNTNRKKNWKKKIK